MRIKSKKKQHRVTLEFPMGVTRTVPVWASSREAAETKALKFNKGATAVKR